MKKNYMFKGAIIAMFAASFVACQSTPEAEAPAEEVVTEEVVEEAPVEEVAADTTAVEEVTE